MGSFVASLFSLLLFFGSRSLRVGNFLKFFHFLFLLSLFSLNESLGAADASAAGGRGGKSLSVSVTFPSPSSTSSSSLSLASSSTLFHETVELITEFSEEKKKLLISQFDDETESTCEEEIIEGRETTNLSLEWQFLDEYVAQATATAATYSTDSDPGPAATAATYSTDSEADPGPASSRSTCFNTIVAVASKVLTRAQTKVMIRKKNDDDFRQLKMMMPSSESTLQ